MNDVQIFHSKAMDLAEQAFVAKLRSDYNSFTRLSREAFALEKQAADLLSTSTDEPNRSVLHRSAASLAIECNEWREAEKLIARALVGEPPFEIAEELRDLLQVVYFDRHLELKGIKLEETELQFSLAGKAVSHGVAQSKHVLERLKSTETLFVRTIERKQHKAFREKGKSEKSITDNFNLFLSVPRAASFAVTIRLGEPTNQLVFPGFNFKEDLIDEVITCFDLFNNGEDEKLKSRIKDPAYFTNFIALAKAIAPDGDNIDLVGLTAQTNNEIRTVKLTRRTKSIPIFDSILMPLQEEAKFVRVRGRLDYADSRKKAEPNIKLQDEENKKSYSILVPHGMMSDIVKPLWEEFVEIDGYLLQKNKIKMTDIRKVES